MHDLKESELYKNIIHYVHYKLIGFFKHLNLGHAFFVFNRLISDKKHYS